MSSAGPPFGSNNPFRRKPAVASDNPAASPRLSSPSRFDINNGRPASPATAAQPPITTFRSAAPDSERADGEQQPVQQKPRKIVKKVRVQSPPPSPPSPPEDAVPVTRFPAPERLGDEDDDTDSESNSTSDSNRSYDPSDDPFNAASAGLGNGLATEPPLPQIPANPFARTLQDIEGGGQAHDVNATVTSPSKGSLDVDSFKRLLLTGYANLPNPPSLAQPLPESVGNHSGATHGTGAPPDGASATDASSVAKQPTFDALQETPRSSHEISESEAPEERKGVLPSSPLATVPSALARKKPPPPSSRHGKLIKIELGTDANPRRGNPASSSKATDLSRDPNPESVAPLQSPQGTTNMNKPLPAPPFRAPADEEVESPFDREAAGKVPEEFSELQAHPQSPTPPLTTRSRSGSHTSTQSRKPAAPPPRRHGRGDSKPPSIHPASADEDPPRSSMESNRSRAESLRISVNSEKPSNAPAPPPPRRPGHARQGSSFVNNHGSFPSAISPSLSEKERSPLGSGFTPIISPGAQPRNLQGSTMAATGSNGQTKIMPPPPPPTRKQSMRRPPNVRGMENSNGTTPIRRVSREKDSGTPLPPPPPPRTRGGGRPNVDHPAAAEGGSRKTSVGSIQAGTSTPPTVEGGHNGEDILADLDALQKEVDELMKKATT
ncbi:hypothetical protein SAMD00023353_5500150 [Rosellinia necatrix]|uniref:Uncharacterized protein n=1 Tax=Rosellinia necatrix TaxID=77044 RepID=A0A1W2TQT8_ROSNE|nr:hypothetical protein SAMD00023353_5500150 [Rosellinia necatrix]